MEQLTEHKHKVSNSLAACSVFEGSDFQNLDIKHVSGLSCSSLSLLVTLLVNLMFLDVLF